MLTEQRFDLMIYGKVQGVGFRYSAMLKAESLGIKGYVKNQRDGSVFVTVQWATTAVDNWTGAFEDRLQQMLAGLKKLLVQLKNFVSSVFSINTTLN